MRKPIRLAPWCLLALLMGPGDYTSFISRNGGGSLRADPPDVLPAVRPDGLMGVTGFNAVAFDCKGGFLWDTSSDSPKPLAVPAGYDILRLTYTLVGVAAAGWALRRWRAMKRR